MECPACKEPMVVLEYDAIEVDYCVACRGAWLDAGELDLLFGDPQACAAFLAAGGEAPTTKEKPRRCPMCRKRMAKGVTGGDHPIIYDYCVRREGLWFDAGELDRVLEHGHALGVGSKMGEHLRAVFAHKGTPE